MNKIPLTILFIFGIQSCCIANIYLVSNNLDAALTVIPGSIREAINEANSNIGNDTIEFLIGGSDIIMLTNKLPAILDSLMISGINSSTGNNIILDGQSIYNIINTNAQLKLHDLIIQNAGNNPFNWAGAVSIYNSSSDTTSFSRCIFRNNKGGNFGGAIYSDSSSGFLYISNSDFVNNYSVTSGSSIFYSGQGIHIISSNFVNNSGPRPLLVHSSCTISGICNFGVSQTISLQATSPSVQFDAGFENIGIELEVRRI